MGFSQINSSCMVGATAVGSATCPENNITPVKLSRIINIKGRSHVNFGTMTIALIIIMPAVAAAASAPSSLTSINAF